MEIRNFYIFLKKRKYILLFIPALALAITAFFVMRMPGEYETKTQIVTGIVDQTQQVVENQGSYGQDTKNNEEFLNLQETLQLEKVVSQVSYQLLLHDLQSNKPFRNPKALVQLSPATKKSTIALLNQKQAAFDVLNVNIPDEKAADSLVTLMGYHYDELLKKNLTVFHTEGSDLITINGVAENPVLAAYMVNNLYDKFIAYYSGNVSQGHNKSSDFLGKLLAQKQAAMNKKIADLQDFKVKNGILDMGDESKDVYSQISELETSKQEAEKNVIAYSGALKGINDKFDPKDRQYLEASSTKINGKIMSTRERLRSMNDKYAQSNFDPKYKKSIDSLQDVLNTQLGESSDKYIANPLAAKESIVQEKLKMENELDLARYSANSLSNQINSLKAKMNNLVPAQAEVKSYERDIDVATKEYLDVQDKYNQANVSTVTPLNLRQLQIAMPGTAKPSKKILLVIISGITCFVLCLIILLVSFYMDDAVHNSDDLERKTQIPVIGELNLVAKGKQSLVRRKGNANESDIRIFRNLLRSIRFEIDMEMKGGKVLTITSLTGMEGKTLFSFSLAHAYAMMNKNVLLIDGNFGNPVISDTVHSKEFLEDFLNNRQPGTATANGNELLAGGEEMRLLEISNETSVGETIQHLNAEAKPEFEHKSAITILGNKGGDVSLLEISNQANIRLKIDELRNKFDVIIIETGPLNTFNKTKEWMLFSDKTIGVFAVDQHIKSSYKKNIKYLKTLNGNMLGWVLNKVAVNQDTEN